MGIARSRGRAAEALVAAYWELLGARVIARNERVAGVELDLVVEEGETIVVVEVKFRGRSDYGGAALALGARQRERLLSAASALRGLGSQPRRIDVIALELTPDGASLRHYRNAVAHGW